MINILLVENITSSPLSLSSLTLLSSLSAMLYCSLTQILLFPYQYIMECCEVICEGRRREEDHTWMDEIRDVTK